MTDAEDEVVSLLVVGSTGSIGRATLDVVRRNRRYFRVETLAVNKNSKLAIEQALEFQPKKVIVADSRAYCEVRSALAGKVIVETGSEALREATQAAAVDIVVVGVVGIAGLFVVLDAIAAEKAIALANKECFVAGGQSVTNALRANSMARVFPVDSEHNAIYQCLWQRRESDVKRIILTASGGPFLGKSMHELNYVTPEMALSHPTWKMGSKISIDSATMINKGFEVIEASYLFQLPAERIDILIHPQSVVHGVVEYHDGSMLAGLSMPDMRIPIGLALDAARSDRIGSGKRSVAVESGADFLQLSQRRALEFFEVDRERFSAVSLCYQVLRQGGVLGAVLNAANDICVDAFLKRQIVFPGITAIVSETVEDFDNVFSNDIREIQRADAWGRERASQLLGTYTPGQDVSAKFVPQSEEQIN